MILLSLATVEDAESESSQFLGLGEHIFGCATEQWHAAGVFAGRTMEDFVPPDNITEEQRLASIRSIFDRLPQQLRQHVRFSPQMKQKLGLGPVITVDRGQSEDFRWEEFWKAVQKAIQGRSGQITSSQGRVWSVHKESVSTEIGSPFVKLRCQQTGEEKRLTHPLFPIFLSDKKSAKEKFKLFRNWFDFSNEACARFFEKVFSQGNVLKRASTIEAELDRSATAHYDSLRKRNALNASDLLPPSLAALKRFLRLPETGEIGDFSSAYIKAADLLTKEEGLFEAWQRLTLLPIPLPQNFARLVASQHTTSKQDWHTRFRSQPLSWLQMLFWAAVQDCEKPPELSVLHQSLDGLVDDTGREQACGFMELLQLSYSWLQADETNSRESNAILAVGAWIHAGQIHRILRRTSNEGKSLNPDLMRVVPTARCKMFHGGFVHDVDAAIPESVYPALLLENGINALISEANWMTIDANTRSRITSYIEENGYDLGHTQPLPNKLGSFLARTDPSLRAETESRDGGEDQLLLKRAAAALMEDLNTVEHWAVLVYALNHHSKEQRNWARIHFKNLLRQHGLAKFYLAPEETKSIFQDAAKLSLSSEGANSLTWLLPSVKHSAKTFAGSDRTSFDLFVLQLLLDAAISEKKDDQIVIAWANAVLDLLQACPSVAGAVRIAIGREFHRCRRSEQLILSPVLLEARRLD